MTPHEAPSTSLEVGASQDVIMVDCKVILVELESMQIMNK